MAGGQYSMMGGFQPSDGRGGEADCKPYSVAGFHPTSAMVLLSLANPISPFRDGLAGDTLICRHGDTPVILSVTIQRRPGHFDVAGVLQHCDLSLSPTFSSPIRLYSTCISVPIEKDDAGTPTQVHQV